MDDAINGLVADAYAAALGDGSWDDWAWSAARQLGGVCGTFYVVEASGRIRQQVIAHEDPLIVERYVADGIGRFDPQVAHVARLPTACVYADTDHVDWDDPTSREYFGWQAAYGKLKHYVTVATRLNGGTHMAGLSVHRHVDAGPTPDRSRRIMGRLLPDINRALELGFLHAHKLTAAYWDGLLTGRQEASLLLSGDGRVLRTNPAMEALLVRGDGLRCTRGRLEADGGRGEAQLASLVAGLAAGRAMPGGCRLDRPSGKAGYVVSGYPLSSRAAMLVAVEAAALVTVVDPAERLVPTSVRWRDAYGLTIRETQLAELLFAGHSVETAAEHLAVTASTARVHLRNLFGKTGTTRQAELLLRLARLTI